MKTFAEAARKFVPKEGERGNTLGKCRQADSQVIMIVSSRFGKVQYKNAWAIKSNGNKIVQMVRKEAGERGNVEFVQHVGSNPLSRRAGAW